MNKTTTWQHCTAATPRTPLVAAKEFTIHALVRGVNSEPQETGRLTAARVSFGSPGGDRVFVMPTPVRLAPIAAEVSSVKGEARPQLSTRRVFGDMELENLALEKPERLADLILSDGLGAADLSMAAEIFSKAETTGRVISALVHVTQHESPFVREGAVYGLFGHRHNLDALNELRRLAIYDKSPGVREAASEALEDA